MSIPKFASAPFTVGQLNALVKIVGAKNVPGILDGSLKVTVKQPGLLKQITIVAVDGVQRFVDKDCLDIANVGWASDSFKLLFLDKVEENIPETRLTASRLERASSDGPILAELGKKAEVQLYHLFALLKKQASGENGVLSINLANIFYIRDKKNELQAVRVHWGSVDDFWMIQSFSIEDPSKWPVDWHIISLSF